MEEEADVGAGQLAEEVGGEEEEVVVLYPDRITRAVLLHDLGGELRDESRRGMGGAGGGEGRRPFQCVRVGGCLAGWLCD